MNTDKVDESNDAQSTHDSPYTFKPDGFLLFESHYEDKYSGEWDYEW